MIIFKICPRAQWQQAEAAGVFHGASIDLTDGFIHFSSAAQVKETARRHFAHQDDLVLVGVETEDLGGALRWEPSRGGDLFPHLHGPLPITAVRSVEPLRLGEDGGHVFPPALELMLAP